MGFITPGVHYVFDKNRRGRHNKVYSNMIFANENKNFNNRYPNNLHLRDVQDIKSVYNGIINQLRLGESDSKNNLDILRLKLQKYVLLMHKVENLLKLRVFPMSKDEAMKLLATVILIQGRQLELECEAHLDEPPLQASLSKQLELINGGCILLNKYFNNQLTIDLDDYKDYEIENNEIFPYVKIEDEETSNPRKSYTITDLNDDLLVNILSMSNNINNIASSCKFFYNFVLQHNEFISYEMVISKYVHRYKLKFNSEPNSMSDEHHHSNSHTLKVSDNEYGVKIHDFRDDSMGNFSLTRYKDPDVLTVISSNAFDTSYMTYQIYKSLNVDHVIPPAAWLDLKEKYENEVNELADSERINKEKFKEFWDEYPIKVPYLDPENPNNIDYVQAGVYVDKLRIVLDLMISKTRFSNSIEDLFYFIVSLLVSIEYDKVVDSSVCHVPVNLLKKYAVYYMKQKELENENPIEPDDENERVYDNDDQLWSKLKFKNPSFYILLKRSASEEFEELLCPLFYDQHLVENSTFWMTLKEKKEGELIEEMMNIHGTSPSAYIMRNLAF